MKMKKNKLFNLLAIMIGVMTCFVFGKVQAAEITSSFDNTTITRKSISTLATRNSLLNRVLGVTATRESGNIYEWNKTTTGDSKKVWKIASYSSLTSTTPDYSKLIYCLNAKRGFGNTQGQMAEGSKDNYTTELDMFDITTTSEIANYAGESLGKNYNKILWLLDNSYMPTEREDYQTSIEYKKLMEKANIKIDTDERINLTEEDIEVVQQMAIWHFTNESDNSYNNSNLPSLYLNGEELSSIYFYTDEYGTQITGRKRQNKAAQLYKYFIDNAPESYTREIPTLKLEGNPNITKTESNYLIGPYILSGNNLNNIQRIGIATASHPYTLLDSSKNQVNDNDFTKVLGGEFYLQIPTTAITSSTEFQLNLVYKYNIRTLTFMTDAIDPTNTQPVVIIENKEEEKEIEIVTIINLMNIEVEKTWEDNNNQDGVRPNQVKVALYEGNTKKDEQILQSSNSWSYRWNNLLAGDYSVRELDSNGNPIGANGKLNNDYPKVAYALDGIKTIITNIHTPEEIEISGTKTWEDSNNQDGKRPESIIVNLYANGEKIDSKEVRGPWTYSFTNLPKYKNGEEIKYTIDEETVEEYSKTVEGYNITNKYTPGIIEVAGTKTWEDSNNQDGKRPESIIVNLYANGEKIDSKEVRGPWTYSFTNLPKYKNGEEIKYTVDEETVKEYSKTVEGYNIKNKYTPGIIEISGIKTWEDNNNQDGKRPESIIVNLYANGEKIDSKEVRGPLWTYSFANLPKYKNGEEIKYTVDEETVEEYSKTVEGYNITNKYTPGIIEISGIKTWEDNNNQDGKRPESIIVNLYANGEKIDSKEVRGPWTYRFTNLPKYKNGEEIKYTVDEETVKEYSKTVEGYNITNKYTPEKTNKTVIKMWNDESNEDKIRPRDIEVQLYKIVDETKISLGEEYKVTLSETNNWTYTWENLDIKEDGKNIVYTVEEISVPNDYTVEYSAEDYSNTDTIIITNTHIVELPTGTYNVILKKIDNEGNPLTGAVIKVNGQEYTVGSAEIAKNVEITSENPITLEYVLEEIKAPEGYIELTNSKTIKIKIEVERLDKSYNIKRVNLVDEDGNTIADNEVNVTLDKNTSTISISVINNSIQKKLDLALRKFITQINDTKYSREPVVDTSTIETTGTATYKHIKQPIAVQKGDIVTYTIRVYNEGELDGYVDKITDYLPNNLLPIIEGIDGIDAEKYKDEIEFNSNWLWVMSNDDNSVTTTITSKLNSDTYSLLTGLEDITDTKLNAYIEGADKLDYIDVQIKCLVTDKAVRGEYLTNIAEITEAQDINGVQGDGQDSKLGNVDYSNLSDYKNEEATKSTNDSYIKGQEDDDDFEKLVVKEFDLSLRKFITKVNETSYSREPKVDTSKLGTVDESGKTITTAIYSHSKEPVIVETGDIVTYKIRIYNEGTIDGFADEIADNIPEGLEFLPNSSVNVSYRWKMIDSEGNETDDVTKAVIIATDHLSDTDKSNIIRAVTEKDEEKILSYKDVEVQFKVIAKAEKSKNNTIINEAQISEDSDRDIDSIPNRDEKYNYTGSNEDDIDYEPIKLQYFDLSLKKFITKVNTIDYNNRYPEVIFDEDGNIKYQQTKDPVLVATNDILIYTIRVYNEGEKPGYATEIIDNLPENLEFLPENEINKQYGWKLIDSEGNVTEDLTKAVKVMTDVLKDELIEALVVQDGQKILSYKDVQIAFKITASNQENKIVVNTAEISKDSDDDVDSIPNNNDPSEDDTDKEYVKVQYFDLALKKWVTEIRVTCDGKTTTTKTGFSEDTDEIAKVDLVAKKMKKTTVKLIYQIKVINEGKIPGYAYEVKDYIPKGLDFVQEDNEDWKEEKDGIVVTDKLKDTLLNPGESATVEIVLTWKNSTTNTGLKTNYAEISEDSGDDIDSTPDNFDKKEDDIDDAQVILSIKTAGAPTYIGLTFLSITILAGGIFLIKKYVIK